MALVIRTAKTIRNNWKKSTFLAIVVTWGGTYTKNYLDIQSLMRTYCAQAAQYGHQTLPVTINPRKVTVILNPNASKRTAQTDFDKYCAPLLHLAGLNVEIIKTESEGHGRRLIETLVAAETEAIIVAGGDGTLSEVVTGLLRRTLEQADGSLVPIGILPLGRNNSVGKTLFPGESKVERVKSLADATMAVIEEYKRQIDVMRIEIQNETEKKPVYGVAAIKWGAYRDAEVKKDSYWYFGGFKKYATYIINGFKNSLSWNCKAHLFYTLPCPGCSNCYAPPTSKPQSKWFKNFLKETNTNSKILYQKIINPDCAQKIERLMQTTDMNLVLTSNVIPDTTGHNTTHKLTLFLGPEKVTYLNFITDGWKSEKGEPRAINDTIEARTVEITPLENGKDVWFSIDSEEFELKPIKVTLLPNILTMYTKKVEQQTLVG